MAPLGRPFTVREGHGKAGPTVRRPQGVTSRAKVGTPSEMAGPTVGVTGAVAAPITAQAGPGTLDEVFATLIGRTKEGAGQSIVPVAKAQGATLSFSRSGVFAGRLSSITAGASSREGSCTCGGRPRTGLGKEAAAIALAVGRAEAEAGPAEAVAIGRPISSTGPTLRT